MKFLFQSIIHIIHPRFLDIGSKLNSVQVWCQAHSNKIWAIKFIFENRWGLGIKFCCHFVVWKWGPTWIIALSQWHQIYELQHKIPWP